MEKWFCHSFFFKTPKQQTNPRYSFLCASDRRDTCGLRAFCPSVCWPCVISFIYIWLALASLTTRVYTVYISPFREEHCSWQKRVLFLCRETSDSVSFIYVNSVQPWYSFFLGGGKLFLRKLLQIMFVHCCNWAQVKSRGRLASWDFGICIKSTAPAWVSTSVLQPEWEQIALNTYRWREDSLKWLLYKPRTRMGIWNYSLQGLVMVGVRSWAGKGVSQLV